MRKIKKRWKWSLRIDKNIIFWLILPKTVKNFAFFGTVTSTFFLHFSQKCAWSTIPSTKHGYIFPKRGRGWPPVAETKYKLCYNQHVLTTFFCYFSAYCKFWVTPILSTDSKYTKWVKVDFWFFVGGGQSRDCRVLCMPSLWIYSIISGFKFDFLIKCLLYLLFEFYVAELISLLWSSSVCCINKLLFTNIVKQFNLKKIKLFDSSFVYL